VGPKLPWTKHDALVYMQGFVDLLSTPKVLHTIANEHECNTCCAQVLHRHHPARALHSGEHNPDAAGAGTQLSDFGLLAFGTVFGRRAHGREPDDCDWFAAHDGVAGILVCQACAGDPCMFALCICACVSSRC
jgi:hypothetical protein